MSIGDFKLNILIGHGFVREEDAPPRLTHLIRDEDKREITVYLPGSLTPAQIDVVAPLVAQVFDEGRRAPRLIPLLAAAELNDRPFELAP